MTEVQDLIAALVPRTGNQASYYAALDAQHFGPHPTASNFLDFANVEEALQVCYAFRGTFEGSDHAELLERGTDPNALCDREVCRYLLFPARGQLGLAFLADLPADAVIELTQEKPGTPLSLVISRTQPRELRIERPATNIATAIIGANVLWTIHPGLPLAPRSDPTFERAGFRDGDTLTVEALRDPLSNSGRDLRSRFADHDVIFTDVLRAKVPL